MSARVRQLEETATSWTFTFRPARARDFSDLIVAFKQTIPGEERAWDGDAKRWIVIRSPQNEARLASLFGNFRQSLGLLRSQLPLFPLEASHAQS